MGTRSNSTQASLSGIASLLTNVPANFIQRPDGFRDHYTRKCFTPGTVSSDVPDNYEITSNDAERWTATDTVDGDAIDEVAAWGGICADVPEEKAGLDCWHQVGKPEPPYRCPGGNSFPQWNKFYRFFRDGTAFEVPLCTEPRRI